MDKKLTRTRKHHHDTHLARYPMDDTLGFDVRVLVHRGHQLDDLLVGVAFTAGQRHVDVGVAQFAVLLRRVARFRFQRQSEVVLLFLGDSNRIWAGHNHRSETEIVKQLRKSKQYNHSQYLDILLAEVGGLDVNLPIERDDPGTGLGVTGDVLRNHVNHTLYKSVRSIGIWEQNLGTETKMCNNK